MTSSRDVGQVTCCGISCLDASNVSTTGNDTINIMKSMDSSPSDLSPDTEVTPAVTSPHTRSDTVVAMTTVDEAESDVEVEVAPAAESDVMLPRKGSQQVRTARLIGSFSPSLSTRDGQTRRIAEYTNDSWLTSKHNTSDDDTDSSDERKMASAKLESPRSNIIADNSKVSVVRCVFCTVNI